MWTPGGIYHWVMQFPPSPRGTHGRNETGMGSGEGWGVHERQCAGIDLLLWNVTYIGLSMNKIMHQFLWLKTLSPNQQVQDFVQKYQQYQCLARRPLFSGHSALGRGALFGLDHCWMLQARCVQNVTKCACRTYFARLLMGSLVCPRILLIDLQVSVGSAHQSDTWA